MEKLQAETGVEKLVDRGRPVEKSSVVLSNKQHGPHRSRARIIYDVLLFLGEQGEVVKTHVMYGVNLSFDQYNRLLKHLEKQELITTRREGLKTCVQITSKGEESLKSGKAFLKLIGEL